MSRHIDSYFPLFVNIIIQTDKGLIFLISFSSAVGYILGLLILFVVTKIFFKPIRFVVRLIANSILGALALWLINLLHPIIGIYIGINPITALVTGLLGLPGICLLLLLQIIF